MYGHVVRVSRTRACAAGVALAALLAACGDAEPAAAPERAARAEVADETTPEPTPEPSPSPTGPDVADLLGDVVWSAQQTLAACDTTAATRLDVLPDAQALITCDGGFATRVDLLRGDTLWRTPAVVSSESISEQLITTRSGVYVITATTTPAVDLQPSVITHAITSYDMSTGSVAWTRPLEQSPPPGIEDDSDDSSWTIHDGAGPSGAGGLVLVEGDYVSAFDVATGKPLWAVQGLTPEGTGEYAGNGIAVHRDGTTWTAYTVETGEQLWSKQVPDVGVDSFRSEDGVWSGIGREGLMRVRLVDGQLLDNRLFPAEWEASLVADEVAVAYVSGKLDLYDSADLRTPLWSVKSGPVEPLAVSRELVLVQAESGLVVLDGATGAVRTDVTLPPDSSSFRPAVDGFMPFTTADGPAVLLLGLPEAAAAPSS